MGDNKAEESIAFTESPWSVSSLAIAPVDDDDYDRIDEGNGDWVFNIKQAIVKLGIYVERPCK